MMKRLFLVFVMCVHTLQSFAATVPVSNMQNAVSGVMQANMVKKGFAANDPRFSQTLVSAGSSIAGAAAAAATVTLAGVTAPAWITAGITVGLAAAFGYAINLAVSGVSSWLINQDGTVTMYVPSDGASSNLVNGAPTFSATYSDKFGVNHKIYSSSVQAMTAAIQIPTGLILDICRDYGLGYPAGSGACYYHAANSTTDVLTVGYSTVTYGSPNCFGTYDLTYDSSWAVSGSTCVANPPAQPVASTVSPASAITAIPASDLSKPLNPAIVGALANRAWQQAAAQAGYAGLPYDASNPITSADAVAWQAANPASWPTVGDAVAPQAAPSGGTAATPFTLPTSTAPISTLDTTANPTTGTNPATGAQVNLGVDPGIGAPTLESTPTAQMILNPLLNLFPSLKSFAVPSHSAVCPKPSMALYGKNLVLSGHCDLLETVRPTLYAVMAFVWLVLALFIILAA